MPLGRAVPLIFAALLALTSAACASGAGAPAISDTLVEGGTARMPREIRLGMVDMAVQAVESDVSRDEVASALGPMLANAPVCMRWPALWMEQVRRTMFVVRYDLMERDWGGSSVRSAQELMDEFIELGFLTARPASEPSVVGYTLTESGLQYLNGAIEPGRRPHFCAPAERRLVEITSMTWERTPCGTLRVGFTHRTDDWPSWASAEHTRTRLRESWPLPGETARGSVSLSRVWYSRSALPPGFRNGALMSSCYDAARGQVTGTDLDLTGRDIE